MSILAWVHIESSAEFMKISGKSLSKFNANLKFVSKLWLPRLYNLITSRILEVEA